MREEADGLEGKKTLWRFSGTSISLVESNWASAMVNSCLLPYNFTEWAME